MISFRFSVVASLLAIVAGGCAGEDASPSQEAIGSVGAGDPSAPTSATPSPTIAPAAAPTAPATDANMPPPESAGTPGPAGPNPAPPRPTAIVPPTPGSGGTMAMEPPASGGSGEGGTAGTANTPGNGGFDAGGTATGGSGGSPEGTGGSNDTGAGGTPAGGTLPLGNPAVSSEGCGQATTVTTGKHTISSSNEDRSYIIDIPSNYDMNKPYRLFYTSHWIGSTSEAVRDQNYYFLKPLAEAANEPAIFVAPQSDGDRWQEKDHALFDDLLAYVKENLCIDTTRVFATGFSFGGMITYSLSVNHQKDIRAAVGIAPANYNIFVPEKTHEPIAWMQTTGMGDGTCPWVNGGSDTQGAKYIAIEHATDNGCTVPDDIPIWENGGHVCYDFEGCPAEFPVKACTFAGGHTNIDNEGNVNWIAQESWDFFMQF